MRGFGSDRGAEPEAKPELLLRIRQRRAGPKDPCAAQPTFSPGSRESPRNGERCAGCGGGDAGPIDFTGGITG